MIDLLSSYGNFQSCTNLLPLSFLITFGVLKILRHALIQWCEINRAMHKMLLKATHQLIACKIMMFFLYFFLFLTILGFAGFNLFLTIVMFLKQWTHAWKLDHHSTYMFGINQLAFTDQDGFEQ